MFQGDCEPASRLSSRREPDKRCPNPPPAFGHPSHGGGNCQPPGHLKGLPTGVEFLLRQRFTRYAITIPIQKMGIARDAIQYRLGLSLGGKIAAVAVTLQAR